jgi:hypothetical protein
VLQWATIPPHIGQQSVNFFHRGNVLQRPAKAATEGARGGKGGKQAARGRQRSGKGWQKTGKVPKFSRARLLLTVFSSRGDNQQSTHRQLGFLKPTSVDYYFLEHPYGYD